MNNPYSAYDKARKQTVSGREIEASVLMKAATLLRQNLQTDWSDKSQYAELAEALRFNQKLWNILQREMENEENPLPDQLKANILSLGLFVQRTIISALAKPEKEEIERIVEINENLAAGLSPKLPVQENSSEPSSESSSEPDSPKENPSQDS